MYITFEIVFSKVSIGTNFHVNFRKKKDLDMTRRKKDESDVLKVMELLKSLADPFDVNMAELINISSGVVASDDVRDDLLNVKEVGDQNAINFMENRLICEEPDIFSPIKQNKSKTFKSMSKNVRTKSATGNILCLKNDRNLFARLLLIGKDREIDLKEILSYPLRSFPMPLATFDGGLVKTCKAKLLHKIESETPNVLVEKPSENNTLVVDGMALLQSLKGIPKTFKDVADVVLKQLISTAVFHSSKRVDFVTDRYPSLSTKTAEREKRASSGTQAFKIYGPTQDVPKQWKKFMSLGQNKEQLVEILFQCWCDANPDALRNVQLLVAHKNLCHRIQRKKNILEITLLPELTCDHEEADTRLLLHAKHAAAHRFQDVVIRSPDTDVFIIAIASPVTCNMFFDTGVGNNRRILSISQCRKSLGDRWSKALLGFHIFTGKITLKLFSFILHVQM